jgi:hypothetical protein
MASVHEMHNWKVPKLLRRVFGLEGMHFVLELLLDTLSTGLLLHETSRNRSAVERNVAFERLPTAASYAGGPSFESRRSVILIEYFLGFHQSLQANVSIVP